MLRLDQGPDLDFIAPSSLTEVPALAEAINLKEVLMARSSIGDSRASEGAPKNELSPAENSLIFVVAVQALVLFLAAFFLGGPRSVPSRTDGERIAGKAGQAVTKDMPRDWRPQLPTDLLPESLPIPRFAPRDEKAADRESENEPPIRSEELQSNLSALRVASVSYRVPVAVTVALEAPEAPARIVPGTISLAGFGGGHEASNRRGWGGRAVDGVGAGMSGLGSGGGECSQGSGRYPGIIERSRQIIPY